MNCFKLIKTVLDEAYAEIQGDDATKDQAIRLALDNLSKEYRELETKGCLDYSDPARRFAYIYRYTTSHANYVYSVLDKSTSIAPVFQKPNLRVATIGGGPGSDFLGILKYCQLRGVTPDIKCLLVDRDPAWGESWMDVDDKVGTPFKFSTVFHPIDVTDVNSYATHKKHFSSDVFTFCYFLSEVYALRGQAEPYFNALFSGMPQGAAVVFIDNNSHSFVSWFDGLASANGVTIHDHFSGTMQMPWDEEKSDLGEYFTKFGSPKLQSNLAYRIGFKK